MNSGCRLVANLLTAVVCLVALEAQASDAPSKEPRTAAAEHCLEAMGMQDIQPFREMAKELSPEIVLDRVFSAVAPDFQRALLSRPSKQASQPEAMRDPKYILPAIATVPLSNPWVNVTNDGRVLEPAAAASSRNSDSVWTRVEEADMGSKPVKRGFPFPFFMPAPQRY